MTKREAGQIARLFAAGIMAFCSYEGLYEAMDEGLITEKEVDKIIEEIERLVDNLRKNHDIPLNSKDAVVNVLNQKKHFK